MEAHREPKGGPMQNVEIISMRLNRALDRNQIHRVWGTLGKRCNALRGLKDESGQVLPWLVLLIFMFLGMGALTIDVGHGLLVRRQLQASADAAALAAALTLPNSSYSTIGKSYSSFAGSKNAYFGYTVATPVITTRCSSTVAGPPWNIPCTSTSPNVVQVTETATFPTFFAGVIGFPTMTVNVMSTASKGAKPQPYNVAIVLDTTPSMDTYDSNCGKTQLQCATAAVQTILQGLAPSQDFVSLFTFPNVTSSSASNDYNCSSRRGPSTGPYTFPSKTATSLSTSPYNGTQMTYQITDYSNDFRGSDTSKSLSSSSNISLAVGGKSGCAGMATSNENTYYAGALYAAQASLIAAQAAHPGTQNALIFLSDGNATAKEQSPGGSWSAGTNDMVSSKSQAGTGNLYATNSGTYPSWVGQCGQGVDAANYAANYTSGGKADGTLIFTIAYGSSTQSTPDTYDRYGRLTASGNCASDVNAGNHKNITPCQAMQQMSSGWPTKTSHFYSDYYAPGGDSGCQAADANNTITSLNDIAASIVGQLSGARLIPNGTP